MQGDMVKALKIVSKAKGWDPDVIVDVGKGTTAPFVDIENFNQPTQIFVNQAGTGKLPQGTPTIFPEATGPVLEQSTTFNVPDFGRETESHRTTNADPFDGKGAGTNPV